MKLVRGKDGHAYLYVARKEGPRARPLRGSEDVPYADGAESMATGSVVGACEHVEHIVRNSNGIPCSGNAGR